MDEIRLHNFLHDFREGEVYRRLEEYREKRIKDLMETLSYQNIGWEEVCRLRGEIQGLRVDLVTELHEMLDAKLKGQEQKKGA